MKQSFICIALCVFVFSCTKSNLEVNQSGSYPSSIRYHLPGKQIVDSFTYNADHLIAGFYQYDYDSSGSTPVLDSVTIVFSFAPNSKLPNSYLFSDEDSSNVLDSLFYDDQNRIVKDTSTNGSARVTYYTYNGNNVASTFLNYNFSEIDSLFLDNNNVIKLTDHSYMSNTLSSSQSIPIAYSAYTNPAYFTDVSSSIGPLLYLLGYKTYQIPADLVSKNAASSLVVSYQSFVNATITFSYITDSKGRIVKEPAYYSFIPLDASITYSYY